jgi:hypothetical protein
MGVSLHCWELTLIIIADEAVQRLAAALLKAVLHVGGAVPEFAADVVEQLELYAARVVKTVDGGASPRA